ncbi:hypothetical protein DH2020_025875 [Rehmannia glutinosa]|uniref:Uncharacterized protein n=1 Tax=Rehmannia glutinosa TaxID=99300 RepID=A0ABR0W2F6_REHGL
MGEGERSCCLKREETIYTWKNTEKFTTISKTKDGLHMQWWSCEGNFKELIKPSSPTPNHLKNLKLSLLDQLAPPVYISLIFFYEANELKGLIDGSTNHAQICQQLKQSLSNTLTLFYPLAGKIDPDNFTIDCNDNGVEFIEARAQARLEDILHDPKLDQFQQYLPVDPLGGIYKGDGTLFMLQINFFECGGIAIGACISHTVADGSSLVDFMNAWASTCRGKTLNLLVTKKFVFDKKKLSALKQEATGWFPNAGSSDYVKDPTRVEVVSAFIWKHFLEKKLLDNNKSFAAHAVNTRSRASSSLQLEHAATDASWQPHIPLYVMMARVFPSP